ncbi:MAG: DUF1003 domain-containing protein [Sphingobacteriales bacterium]|nr:DUF1003 domain-containing protein [Sphingobacteriales bacterium]
MKPSEQQYIKDLLQTENKQLLQLNEIVTKAIEQEKLLMESVNAPSTEKLTTGQRIADKVAKFGGSWKFIILFAVILTIWIIINQMLPEKQRFDPYPFILMNLILSCIAALQAPVIMMSQNRQEEKDRQERENDYMINLKAEIGIQTLHQKMDLLIQEQFKELVNTQAQQLKLLQQLIDKNQRSNHI